MRKQNFKGQHAIIQSELRYNTLQINNLLKYKGLNFYSCWFVKLSCHRTILGWVFMNGLTVENADPGLANVISVTHNSGWNLYWCPLKWGDTVFRSRRASHSCLSVTHSRPASFMTAGFQKKRSLIWKHCSRSYGIFYWFFFFGHVMCYWWESGPGLAD